MQTIHLPYSIYTPQKSLKHSKKVARAFPSQYIAGITADLSDGQVYIGEAR